MQKEFWEPTVRAMSSVLSSDQLMVVRMRFLLDMTQEEIAETLGCTRQNVAYHLSIAISILRRTPDLVYDLEP